MTTPQGDAKGSGHQNDRHPHIGNSAVGFAPLLSSLIFAPFEVSGVGASFADTGMCCVEMSDMALLVPGRV